MRNCLVAAVWDGYLPVLLHRCAAQRCGWTMNLDFSRLKSALHHPREWNSNKPDATKPDATNARHCFASPCHQGLPSGSSARIETCRNPVLEGG